MNGKNRKVRGCYSRVSRSFGFVPVPNPPPPPVPPKLYNLPKFTQQLKNNCSQAQKELLVYFENFGHHNKFEELTPFYKADFSWVGSIIIYQHQL